MWSVGHATEALPGCPTVNSHHTLSPLVGLWRSLLRRLCHAGDAGDGTIWNETPFAHWGHTYRSLQLANNYTCATADSSTAYDAYTGAYPWEPFWDVVPEDDGNSTAGANKAEMQMANATFFNSTSGRNKCVGRVQCIESCNWQLQAACTHP